MKSRKALETLSLIAFRILSHRAAVALSSTNVAWWEHLLYIGEKLEWNLSATAGTTVVGSIGRGEMTIDAAKPVNGLLSGIVDARCE